MSDFYENKDSAKSGWHKCFTESTDVQEEGILDRVKARVGSTVDKVRDKASSVLSTTQAGEDAASQAVKKNTPVTKLEKTLVKKINTTLTNFLADASKLSDVTTSDGLAQSNAYRHIQGNNELKEQIVDTLLLKLDEIIDGVVKKGRGQQTTQPSPQAQPKAPTPPTLPQR